MAASMMETGDRKFHTVVCRRFSSRAKKKYAPTLSELTNTAMMFRNITGRERINKP